MTGYTPGRAAYESDCAARPNYHDGTPRKPWSSLGDVERASWEKEPTPRFIPNPFWCETCKGRGYLVADSEWDAYAVQCDDCKDRRGQP